MKELETANDLLTQVQDLIVGKKKVRTYQLPLRVGLDLGTSSLVLVVVDQTGQPVFAAAREATVVRDGLVVDYVGALRLSRELKEQAESSLGIALLQASGAIPPGTIGNNKQVIQHIIEGIGMECVSILDEPTAAAQVLGIQEGAVVDVGGGTTGISILRDGQVVFSADEATGGTQMTLVVAGYYGLDIVAGESRKRDSSLETEIFQIVKPVVEKMARISRDFIEDYGKAVSSVYLVGGATNFSDFTKVFEKELGVPIYQPLYPQFVTPLGIALSMN